MEKGKRLNFWLAYVSWILALALLQFWMQSQASFFATLGLNAFMFVFAFLFLAGTIYLQRYFRQPKWYHLIFLMLLDIVSYLLILALSMFFLVTLDKGIQDQINALILYPREVLIQLFKNLPMGLLRMVTFQDCHHYLDFFYTIVIELGFFSPLLLLAEKKDCTDEKKCV